MAERVSMSPQLPADAWVLRQSIGEPRQLLCGPRVHPVPGGFGEGSHAGPADPANASQLFGSAVLLREHDTLLVPASHTFESLYLHRGPRGFAASNSLALLLAATGTMLPFDRQYGARFATIGYGIECYERVICRWPDGSELLRIAFHNVLIRRDGKLQWQQKPLDPPFVDFAGYRDYLIAVLQQVFARAPWLVPTTSCSSGYDSAGVSVIAAAAGCKQAFALGISRSGHPDSGRPVAQVLGLDFAELPRLDRVDNFAEVGDYFAAGTGGQDACYQRAEPWLQDRIWCTGFGRMWALKGEPNRVLSRDDLAGIGLQEVRLLRRFVQVPVMMIGARYHPELNALARSPACAAYRIGGDYDKPIARRLLEEAAVPRGSFAVQKHAVSTLVFRDDSLWSERALAECAAAVPADWQRAAASFGVRCGEWWDRSKYYGLRHLPGGRRLVARFFRDDRIHQHAGLANALRFGAGLQRLVQRYREWLPS